MTDDFAAHMARHRSAERSAIAVTLNMITGDAEASVELVLPMTADERMSVIAALATDLAIALGKVHGTQADAADHLRQHLHQLAADH